MSDVHRLTETIAARVAGRAPWIDVTEDDPSITDEDAYQIQAGLMERLCATGDAIAGYKAAYTSLAMQRERKTGGPIVGAFLRSAIVEDGAVLPLVHNSRNAVEPEVAILLGRDVEGTEVTPHDVMAATACLLPAIEVAVGAPGDVKRSRQMVIATHKTFGSVVLGSPGAIAAGIDLRLEGTVLTVNGEVRGSGTAVEVLGNPWRAAATIANIAARHGARLRAGMVLMTGSIIAALPVSAGDRVEVEFTRLGKVGLTFGSP